MMGKFKHGISSNPSPPSNPDHSPKYYQEIPSEEKVLLKNSLTIIEDFHVPQFNLTVSILCSLCHYHAQGTDEKTEVQKGKGFDPGQRAIK